MRRSSVHVRLLVPAVSCLFFLTANAATITVNSAADALGNDGQCTLREAITAANTNTASGAAAGECVAGSPGADTIAFNIPGPGVHTIKPLGRMPIFSEPVTIDGYTQPGASANTLVVGNNAVLAIEIDGSNMGLSDMLFVIGAAGASTVRGLVINRIPSTSILIGPTFLGGASNNNTIAGNFIGTDPAGTLLLDAGVSTLISIETSQSHGNLIGGATPAARNVIAGGGTSGASRVLIHGFNNAVQGNYIGTNAAGSAALLPGAASNGIGIEGLDAINNLIGGPTSGMGNVIVATNEAIGITQGSANTIQGNLIGTNAAGTAALGNGTSAVGIATHNAANANVIGGSTPQKGNVISGLRTGIRLQEGPLGITIQGNRIGTDITGTLPIPNGNGIEINAAGPGLIGGDGAAGAGNIIAFSKGNGIIFATSASVTGWSMLGNSIFSNNLLGISFGGIVTPTPNDDQDVDTGPNNLQNYPVLSSVSVTGGTLTVTGSLNSTPNTGFRIEFFASPACDASGYGEGQTYIGATMVTTADDGNASFTVSGLPVAGGSSITATATLVQGDVIAIFTDTSEFSACMAGPVPTGPSITKSFGAATVPMNGSVSLAFTIMNQGTGPLSSVAFTDALPAGLAIATPNGLTGACGGGAIVANPGGASVSLAGATLGAGGACTFSVNVMGTGAGLKNNSVTVRAAESGPGNTSSASLAVVLPPIIVNAFGVPALVVGGVTSLGFFITNPNESSTLTGIGFNNVLPGALIVATPNGLLYGCDGGTITAEPGANSISLAGASLPPGGTCTFVINVMGTAVGPQVDTTGPVSSAEGGNGVPSTAGLVIVLELPWEIPALQTWALILLGLFLCAAAAIAFSAGARRTHR